MGAVFALVWLPTSLLAVQLLLMLWALGRSVVPLWAVYSTAFVLMWATTQFPGSPWTDELSLAAYLALLASVATGLYLLRKAQRSQTMSLLWLIPVLGVCLGVAYFSGDSGQAGPMLGWFERLGMTQAQAQTATVVLRKLVHLATYGFVAGAAAMASRSARGTKLGALAFGGAFSLALAVFDELRQSGFVTRGGSAGDVLLDLTGIAAVLLLLSKYVFRAETTNTATAVSD